MKNCPVCGSQKSSYISICDCGYSFGQYEILDKDKIRTYYLNTKETEHWTKIVKLTRRIHEVQQAKYGKTYVGARGGWPIKKTSKLLGKSVGLISLYIKLADALDEYPELQDCKNMDQAKKRLDLILNASTHEGDSPEFISEDELQEYFENNWDKTPFNNEWKLQRTGVLQQGKYNTGEVGEIDLLARHREKNKWLIIELKKEQSSDQTVGQILRYMGWVKENLAGEEGKVEGIIISESADERIRYALINSPSVSLKIYRRINGHLSLEEPNKAYFLTQWRKLSEHQRKILLEELSKDIQDR